MSPLQRSRLLTTAVVAAGLLATVGPVLVLVASDRSQAAFGDQVQLGGRLSSASVDVEPGRRTVPVTVAALAPGDRAQGLIEVVNAGSLPLHYALLVQPPSVALSRWLAWDLWPAGPDGSCPQAAPPEALLAASTLAGAGPQAVFGDPATGFDPGDRRLDPGQRELLCTAVALPLDAPDTLQGESVTPTFVVAAEHHLGDRP
jgi:hypothetical protein